MKASEILITIIVTVYNIEDYIVQCIESLISQTYSNIEIIIVDDGSTDSSSTICDDLCTRDNRVRVLHKENGGLSDARNYGLQVANGQYVVFVDGDDVVSPDFIAHLSEPIITGKAELVACDLVEVKNAIDFSNISFKRSEPKFYKTSEAICECLLGQRLTVSACGKVCKRELWESNPFPTGKVYEDLYTIPILFSEAKLVAHVPEPLYGQVMRDGSITRTKRIQEKQYLDYYDAIIRNRDAFSREYSEQIKKALMIREITECTRLIRLYPTIENPSETSYLVYEFARSIVRECLDKRVFKDLPTKTKVSATLGFYLPGAQSVAYDFLQLYKGFRARWK